MLMIIEPREIKNNNPRVACPTPRIQNSGLFCNALLCRPTTQGVQWDLLPGRRLLEMGDAHGKQRQTPGFEFSCVFCS